METLRVIRNFAKELSNLAPFLGSMHNSVFLSTEIWLKLSLKVANSTHRERASLSAAEEKLDTGISDRASSWVELDRSRDRPDGKECPNFK